MIYIQLSLTLSPCNETITDVLSYQLGEIGYESFIVNENVLEAYIREPDFSVKKLKEILQNLLLETKVDYKFKELEEMNWNKEWEKNYFQPLIVDNKCLVRSTFHTVTEKFEHEIIIDPKMAFGTGHHQTTNLMLQEILKLKLHNKSVLDMGCGTAVLAILASQMGASRLVAIDFDEWAYYNAKENVLLNNISNVEVKLGEVDQIAGEKFDYILANINRNILLQDIQYYANALEKDGTLIMSGFYLEDVLIIKTECEKHHLNYLKFEQKDNWTAVVCTKK
ncbi:MAG: 50S ribosomal protein L11 methyltransferase [Candidatus Saccharimonadaceae bacterium]